MKTISKIASSIAVVLLTSGAVLAGDTVVQAGPYGQGGTVTYSKHSAAQPPTVALYRDRRGVGKAAPSEQPQWIFHSQTFGSFGNGAPVSFYSESR